MSIGDFIRLAAFYYLINPPQEELNITVVLTGASIDMLKAELDEEERYRISAHSSDDYRSMEKRML